MIFSPTDLCGAYIIEQRRVADERGFFARTFCYDEFRANGLCERFVQCSISHNAKKGTLRGMHFQKAPCEEEKLVSCTRGAIFDVIVDLRKDSDSYLKWEGIELTAENGRALYIPKGLAHGFITLSDDSDVFYQISAPYSREAASGISYRNARVGIRWPDIEPLIISAADKERDEEYLP